MTVLDKRLEDYTEEEKAALVERIGDTDWWAEQDEKGDKVPYVRERLEQGILDAWCGEPVRMLLNGYESLRITTHVILQRAIYRLQEAATACASAKCVWCGTVTHALEVDWGPPDATNTDIAYAINEAMDRSAELIKRHMYECEQHPMRELEARLKGVIEGNARAAVSTRAQIHDLLDQAGVESNEDFMVRLAALVGQKRPLRTTDEGPAYSVGPQS